MKVLVVGKGGREDALVWKIGQSPLVEEIYCAPGSDGISQRPKTECVPIKVKDNKALAELAETRGVHLTVIGPEGPLVEGIVDEFEDRGLRIVGPTQRAAIIEGSKVWTKNFLEENEIPTASFRTFDDPERAERYAQKYLPCVVKADGLAAGKGVIPCFSKEEVSVAISKIMIKKELGEAGNSVVVEEFLQGQEATFKVFTDGEKAIPLLATQDHKPVWKGDRGPNTGGMGAYAPTPVVTKEMEERIMGEIIEPTLKGMRDDLRLYKGILYVGLMITSDGPKVLEFNSRFGDPELQPLVLLMESDIVPILEGIANYRLPQERIQWSEGAAVCVIMASKGYPDTPETGKEIKGLAEVDEMKNVAVFHAGTIKEGRIWKTAGGRVLGVTAKAARIPEAIDLAYEAVAKISWDGEHHRSDIAQKALKQGFQLRMSEGGEHA